MGCRHYIVVDRLEDLVDECDSRSSSRAHEHENFRLVSQLHVLQVGVDWREASILFEDCAVGHDLGERPLFAQQEHICKHLDEADTARLASWLPALVKRRQ